MRKCLFIPKPKIPESVSKLSIEGNVSCSLTSNIIDDSSSDGATGRNIKDGEQETSVNVVLAGKEKESCLSGSVEDNNTKSAMLPLNNERGMVPISSGVGGLFNDIAAASFDGRDHSSFQLGSSSQATKKILKTKRKARVVHDSYNIITQGIISPVSVSPNVEKEPSVKRKSDDMAVDLNVCEWEQK
ncbi:unnamed protein product [Amaranthus hypochondriacus]